MDIGYLTNMVMEGVANIFKLDNGDIINNGVARLQGFSIDKSQCRQHNLLALFNGSGWFESVTEGNYIKLSVNGQLMMSDTDMEKRTNRDFIANAHGDVMIAGLGIGLILHNLEPKVKTGEVTSITVYEKYQDVIDLIAPYYQHLPLTIKCEDILEYKPLKGETYDTIYFDIWPTISTDNLNEIKMLHNRWKFHKRKGSWMNSWVKEFLQREKRKEYNNSYWW